MRTQKYVLGYIIWMLAYEEGVLHVACWVIGSKVELSEHVKVVVNLWSFSKGEAHTLEDVDNLVLNDIKRMTCAEQYWISRTCEVEVVCRLLSNLVLFLKFVDFL